MNSKEKKVKIDYEKVKIIALQKKTTLHQLSKDMGLSDGALGNALRMNGELVTSKAKLLSMLLGVELSEIEPTKVASSDKAVLISNDDADKKATQLLNGMVWFKNKADSFEKKFERISEVVESLDKSLVNLSNRTLLIKKKQEEHDETLEKLSFALVEISEALEYVKKRLPEEEPKVEVSSLEYAKAFIKSAIGSYDQIEENHICELAASYKIQRDMLKLAREEMGYRVETVWGKGNKKVKVWRKPYGEV